MAALSDHGFSDHHFHQYNDVRWHACFCWDNIELATHFYLFGCSFQPWLMLLWFATGRGSPAMMTVAWVFEIFSALDGVLRGIVRACLPTSACGVIVILLHVVHTGLIACWPARMALLKCGVPV